MDIIGKEAVFVPQKYDLFFEQDVDKRSVAVTILDHTKKIGSLKMPNNDRMLINCIHRHFQDKQVSLSHEAGSREYGLYEHLTRAGLYMMDSFGVSLEKVWMIYNGIVPTKHEVMRPCVLADDKNVLFLGQVIR